MLFASFFSSKVNDDDASHATDIGQEIWDVSYKKIRCNVRGRGGGGYLTEIHDCNFSSETFTSVHFVSNNFIYYHTVKLSETLLNIKINEKPLENPVW